MYNCKGWEYSNEDYLGSGGQGVVYSARKVLDDKEYAIKIVDLRKYKRRKDKEKVKKRFEKEEYLLDLKPHKNFIQYVDKGKCTDEIYYFVMEKADTNLAKYLSQNKLSFDEKINLFHQILDGVESLHNNNSPIIHRDLKPTNTLMKEGIPKIADFGIVFIKDETARFTTTNERVGSKIYSHPDTELGRLDEVSCKLDIYSLGKILYFLLSDGTDLHRVYYDKEEYYLPYIHHDPRYTVFDNLFLWTINLRMKEIIGSIEEVRIAFDEACENFHSFPNRVEETIKLGHALFRKCKHKEGTKCLEKAVSLEPNNPYALYHYGRWFEIEKVTEEDTEKRIKYYEKILQNENFTDWYILSIIGKEFLQSKDKNQGQQIIEKAKKLKARVYPAITIATEEEIRKYYKVSFR